MTPWEAEEYSMAYQTMLFPTRLHIESTNICNLDCLFCPYGRQRRQKGYMGLDLFQKLIEECTGHDVRLWLHFLGEPLLNRDLPAMVAFAKAHGLPQVGFSTNGFFLTRDLGEKLIRAGLDRLECSVDGVDPASYQHLRHSLEFSRVVTNLQGFLRLRHELCTERPIVTIQFMKTLETVASLPQARAFWKPFLKPRDFLMTIEDISFAGEMRRVHDHGERLPCKWLSNYAVVLWNGDVVTCVSDYDGTRVMGNVREQSLMAIWHSPGYEELRQKHSEGRFSEGGICAGCDDWALSDGRGYQAIE
jgi:radical SAM protein with 4Fe4S-binding SPASM domain